MTTSFPGEYDSYRAHTKMLIPFVLCTVARGHRPSAEQLSVV